MEVADRAGCLSGHCNPGSHILCCLLSPGDSSFSYRVCVWQAAAASCGTSARSSQPTGFLRIFIRSGVSPGFRKPPEPMPQMPTDCFCSACCACQHNGLLFVAGLCAVTELGLGRSLQTGCLCVNGRASCQLIGLAQISPVTAALMFPHIAKFEFSGVHIK